MTETKLPFSDTNLQTISLRGIQKMEYKLVKRKVKDLKADPNQPRKKFEQDKIDALAQTIQSQGIINPIEIDSSDVIVTGEMRWRASKKANIEEVDCNLLTNLDDITRFERQTIENLHHNIFTSEERENAIKKLWDSEKYKTQEELANRLGANYATIGNILRAYNIRKEIPDQILAESKSISTRDLVNIAGIKNKGDRLKIIEKLAKREIKPSEVRKVVKTIKEVSKKAPELKKEILKPETKISEEKLKEVKEIAKLPKDVRNEVVKEEISIKQAKEIAEFPKPEERQAIIKQIKQTEKASKKIIEQNKQISKGKIKAPVTVENLDTKFLRIWENIEKDIKIKMRKSFLRPYTEKTKQEAINIAERIVEFLVKEFKEDFKKFKEVKLIGT